MSADILNFGHITLDAHGAVYILFDCQADMNPIGQADNSPPSIGNTNGQAQCNKRKNRKEERSRKN
jgi:hypothetical protein